MIQKLAKGQAITDLYLAKTILRLNKLEKEVKELKGGSNGRVEKSRNVTIA
jgi:hypothetical protein